MEFHSGCKDTTAENHANNSEIVQEILYKILVIFVVICKTGNHMSYYF